MSFIVLRDLLAKLNIKHRMCCNKPIDYKMLTKVFLDIIAWLYGEGGNSHLLAYIYRMCYFYGTQFCRKIKILGSILQLVINFLVRFSKNTKLYFIFKVLKNVLVLNGNWNRFVTFLY